MKCDNDRTTTCADERGWLTNPSSSGLTWVQQVRRLAIRSDTDDLGTQGLWIEIWHDQGYICKAYYASQTVNRVRTRDKRRAYLMH